MRKEAIIMFFHMNIDGFQTFWLKCCLVLSSLSKVNWQYIYESVSRISVLFHWSAHKSRPNTTPLSVESHGIRLKSILSPHFFFWNLIVKPNNVWMSVWLSTENKTVRWRDGPVTKLYYQPKDLSSRPRTLQKPGMVPYNQQRQEIPGTPWPASPAESLVSGQ